MKLEARQSPLLSLVGAVATQVVRSPYLSLSVVAHAGLLALLYYFGSYQVELREQQAELASSLRATQHASTAKRLQDLQTIKQLLERSAGDGDAAPPPSQAAASAPQTPEEMVKQARELSKEIDAIDKEIRAKEEATLLGESKPSTEAKPSEPPPAEPASAARLPAERPSAEPSPAASSGSDIGKAGAGAQEPVTQEAAATEVAKLETKARSTLAKRLQRLEAKANGVEVEANGRGASGEASVSSPGAPAERGGQRKSVRAEMAEFIRTDPRIEQTQSTKSYFGGPDFFDHGIGQVPPVDSTGMMPGRGRMIGAGGEYANRLYLNSWYLIGPFAGRHEAGLFDNPSYPPETAVLLDAVYVGKDKRLLKWRYVTSQTYPLVPPDMVEDSVYYGYTEVNLDQARDLTAWIGADDDVQIYLNDVLVWRGGNVNKQSYFDAIFAADSPHLRDYNRTEGKRVLHFNKGRNKIFFKLSNGPNSAFLSMVLTP